MITTTAIITAETIVIVERNEAGLVCQVLGEEPRPASLGEAETMLAAHGFGRTAEWNLEGLNVAVPVAVVDNLLNGVRAARLDQKVGTTHEPFEVKFAHEARDGDLIADMELEGVAVVAASSPEGEHAKIHMVTEGRTWADRYTTNFPRMQLVQVARKIDTRRAAEVAMSAGEGEI